MAGLFDPPHMQTQAVPNPADLQNRQNDALVRRLASGGSNADQLSPAPGAGAATPARQPSLTGIN